MKCIKFLGVSCFVLLLVICSLGSAQDKDNMKWKLAWTSPATVPTENTAITGEVPIPYRFYNSEAWFDFDGDGNLEFYCEDQTPFRGYVYEADGNNQFVYRWHIDYFDTTGNILSRERSSHAVDCDGDGADELIHMHTVPDPGNPRHIPPIRVFKHTAGSAEFLPDPWNWTVAWDAVPTGQGSGSFRPEYYTDAGDFDNDGKGEFAINYKRDPLYHFAIVEVTPPLTPEGVQFTVELMVNKEDYMKPGVEFGNGYNSCRPVGEDLDNDGRAEFFLFNRETPSVLPQADYYIDCTGPNTYDVHGFFKNDPIVMPVPYVRIGENYSYIDLDHDGVKELVSFTKGLTDDVGKYMQLWVGKLNPADPANICNADNWFKIATIDEMLGLDPGGYAGGGGWLEAGDADNDGYADIYFGAGSDGLIMDVEFVGTDISNPEHYNYYQILNLQDALGDTVNGYHSARSAIGDGDGDGQTDIVLWSKTDWDKTAQVPRPGIYVMEYETGSWIDKNNMDWRVAWTSPATVPTLNEAITGEVPIPYRFYNSEAWFDFDGDGNLEFYCEDQTPFRGYVYEADGNDSYVYRWHIDYFDTTGNLLSRERSSHAVDCDGDGADELIHMHTVPDPGDPRHIPPIRVFKHTAGSAEFLPDPWNWTVAWDAVPTGQGSGSFRPEYYTDAGDFDNDGKGEFAINYKRDPLYHFAIVEVTPPLTPEGVQFTVELMIEKEEYMKPGKEFGNGYNSCRIHGEDLDGDGRAEFFLLNRETPAVLPQADYYVDCTGPDTYEVHGFFKDDPIVFPVPYVRIGENYSFIDLDHDGVKEMVSYAKGLTDDVGKYMALWVGKLNPSDPANVVNADNWFLIKTIDEMLGLAPGGYPGGGGWLEAGDADKDGYADIYFGAGSDGLIMDVEFVGTDISNPEHYNYYQILNLQDALGDTVNGYHSARSAIGDGDGDGQTDIVLWSKTDWDKTAQVPRPGIYVMEYGPGGTTGVERPQNPSVSNPVSFALNQNYPNPFNPTTTISYTLDKMADVNLAIYNINGRLIRTLVDARQASGMHSMIWDGRNNNAQRVASGVYFYVLTVNSARSVKKMTLLK